MLVRRTSSLLLPRLSLASRRSLAAKSITTFPHPHRSRPTAGSAPLHRMSAPHDQASSSSAAATMTTRTAMRQNKLVVSAPSTVPRLTGTEPELQTMEGASRLLDQLKPKFTTHLELQAIGLSGRQLPLLTKDESIMPHLFNAAGIRYVQPHPNGDPSQRILLLNVPSSSPTPEIILSTVAKHNFELIPQHTPELGYDNLSSDQVLESLLPESIVSSEGVPSGYTIVGHIAHLNLLDIYLPFRFLVGAIILSKHASTLRTVVNKLDTIDTEFRFFKMELLAGEPDYIATVSESDCTFEFDFRSVYWNSRLHAEHMRLIKKCRPNQVLADVMAGVGPFAVPAAKRGTWVLANDLNPSSYESLVKNGKLNKVLDGEKEGERFDGGLIGKCMDGREFVRWSMVEAWNREFRGRPKGFDGGEKEDEKLREFARKTIKGKSKAIRAAHAARHAAKSSPLVPTTTEAIAESTSKLNINPSTTTEDKIDRYPPRKLIDHFVMNLPAIALEFLDAYRGAYTHLASIVGESALRSEIDSRASSSDTSLNPTPMIHVHCFSKDPFQPALDILTRSNNALGLSPTSPHRLRSKPILPPPQTFAGLRKSSSSPTSTSTEVGNYLTSHKDFAKYQDTPKQTEFMQKVEQEWQERDLGETTEGLEIHYVRDVAPNKQMYCLSFPCPPEVLWEPLSTSSS